MANKTWNDSTAIWNDPDVKWDGSPEAIKYSRGSYGALPGNYNDLTTIYSAQDLIDVAINDNIRVSQSGLNGDYLIHQFKDDVGINNKCSIIWEGQSDLGTYFGVYLQIFNRDTSLWETIASLIVENNENIDFTLNAIIEDLTNYKDENNIIACRVYQQIYEIESANLLTDYWKITFGARYKIIAINIKCGTAIIDKLKLRRIL